MTPDRFQLHRFVLAQEGVFETALRELRDGKKQGHWMWFIFPQLAGLGRSPTARYYAIRSADEARAYLAHPLLGARFRESVDAILASPGKRDAVAIFGDVDAKKLRSSLTLFEAAASEPLFARALHAFFDGPDPATLELLQRERSRR